MNRPDALTQQLYYKIGWLNKVNLLRLSMQDIDGRWCIHMCREEDSFKSLRVFPFVGEGLTAADIPADVATSFIAISRLLQGNRDLCIDVGQLSELLRHPQFAAGVEYHRTVFEPLRAIGHIHTKTSNRTVDGMKIAFQMGKLLAELNASSLDEYAVLPHLGRVGASVDQVTQLVLHDSPLYAGGRVHFINDTLAYCAIIHMLPHGREILDEAVCRHTTAIKLNEL